MKNRRVLLTNAALWALYYGLTTSFLVAFALALGASNLVIGLLGALPWLANLLTQIPGSVLVQHFARKKIYVVCGLIGRLFWIPILAAPFLFKQPILAVVIFYLFVKLGETMFYPAVTSLTADLIPQKHLGDYTGQRLRLTGTFGMVAMVLGGLWLKQFPKESPVGFAVMFGVGVLLAVIATLVMKRVKEPAYRDHEHHTVKEFFTLVGPMKRFVVFSTAFNFAYMFASPFIVVYMLKSLEISYFHLGVAMAMATLAQIITSHYIGKLSDKYGDKPLAIIGHIGTALIPLLFLAITKQNLWMIIPVQIYGGIVWAAADISRFDLLLRITDPRKRAMQVAEYNIYISMALIVGPILGGWMTENVTLILTGIPLVLVLGSILRFLTALLLFRISVPKAREYPVVYVFRQAMHFHPTKGVVHALHVVRRIADGLRRK